VNKVQVPENQGQCGNCPPIFKLDLPGIQAQRRFKVHFGTIGIRFRMFRYARDTLQEKRKCPCLPIHKAVTPRPVHCRAMLYLAALFFALSCVLAQTPTVIDWHVSWFNACPDGFCRNLITVNNQWPPAVVRVKKREVYTLRVFNELNDGECITVHTHGIDQWGSNPHDGVDGVTQWFAIFRH
jgi:hypothetical protein